MNKIKSTKKFLNNWKAAIVKHSDGNESNSFLMVNQVLLGIEAALAILKEPSNTQMQIDTCECPQGSICEFFGEKEQCRYGKI